MDKVDKYNDIFFNISNLIEQSRNKVAVTINTAMVYTYFEIGRMIVEDEQQGKQKAEYGKYLIKNLSARLSAKFGKGFSITNLKQMKSFYLIYSIGQTPSGFLENKKEIILSNNKKNQIEFTLSWSHYLKLMRIENKEERKFYEIETEKNNWSLRELERQFDSSLYERLVLSRNKASVEELSKKGQIIEKPQDLIKDPYILEFLNLKELPQYSESELEQRLIDNLQSFLLELGKGFTFVGRQVRISFGEENFRVDLVFFNRLLKCFVLIDLKIGTLKHQDLGQMQMYVNYYDRQVKLEEENPTIGILLCKDKNDTMVELTLPKDNNQIFASKYLSILPSKEELKNLIELQK
jgi:predicted nuclease of restriction endonuclease-like (RecB) superfamily